MHEPQQKPELLVINNVLVDPDRIIVIRPYRAQFDPRFEPYEDYQATLVHRSPRRSIHARRDVTALAHHLGFRLVGGPHPIAINPAYALDIEPRGGRTTLILTRRGERHSIDVRTAPEDVLSIEPTRPKSNGVASSAIAIPFISR